MPKSKSAKPRVTRKSAISSKPQIDFALDAESSERIANWLEVEPISNPIAYAIECECAWIGLSVEDETEGLVNAEYGLNSCTYENHEKRRSTNEECCQMEFHLVESVAAAKCIVDVRKPIPRKIAAWMRQVAQKLLDGADRVETIIIDDRSRRLIRMLVAGDPRAKFSESHAGLVDVSKPLPPPFQVRTAVEGGAA